MRIATMLVVVSITMGGPAWGTKLSWSEKLQVKKLTKDAKGIWEVYREHLDDSGRRLMIPRAGKDHISVTKNHPADSSATISEPGVTTEVNVGTQLGGKPLSIKMKRTFFTKDSDKKLVVTSMAYFSAMTWRAAWARNDVILPKSLTFELISDKATKTISRKEAAQHARRLGVTKLMRANGVVFRPIRHRIRSAARLFSRKKP